MALVALSKKEFVTFWYRSNPVERPAIRAAFEYNPSINPLLQRRYPGAMYDRSTRTWLVPNETIEEVATFFESHYFRVLVEGKLILGAKATISEIDIPKTKEA